MSNPSPDPAELAWLAGLARALLSEAHAADDLVQDTLVATLERPVPAGASRRAWLATVARRLATRRRRAEGRRGARERAVARPEATADTTLLVERMDQAERLARAVRECPEPYREILLHRFLDDRDPAWIAERLGVRVDTVRRRLREGLERLRARLDRDARARGSDWSVLLLPLARGGEVTAPAGGATATVAVATLTPLLMKTLPLAALALVGVGLFLLVGPDDTGAAPSRAEPVVDGMAGDAPGAPSRVGSPAVEPAAVARVEELDAGRRTPASASAAVGDVVDEPTPKAPPGALFGRVVDAAGRPLPAAVVQAVEGVDPAVEAELGALGYLLGDVTTGVPRTQPFPVDGDGRFVVPAAALAALSESSPIDLVARANGYRRGLVADARAAQPEDGHRIELERGPVLAGRLVTTGGAPAAGVELLATDAGAGLAHVSPSRVDREARRQVEQDPLGPLAVCRAVSDRDGRFELSGLPDGELELLVLSPGWSLVETEPVAVDAGQRTWTVLRTLGVRVTVTPRTDGSVLPELHIAAAVELGFADGTTERFGDLVGHGDGTVSVRFDPAWIPGLGDGRVGERVIDTARFSGTLRVGALERQWEAPPLIDARGVWGVAEVLIDGDSLDAQAITAGMREEVGGESARLAFDPRYTDGEPVEGLVLVRWRVRSGEGDDRRGSGVVWRPGELALDVPAGRVELEVQEANASGSIAPFTTTIEAVAGFESFVEPVLERGGTALVARPEGWAGEWFVRAAYREGAGEAGSDGPVSEGAAPEGEGPEAGWFGAWTHSAFGPELELNALRAGQWRFRLARRADAEWELERVATVVTGELTRAD